MDNDNEATKDDTYQITGSENVAVASVKMKATNEPVKITKMSVLTDDDGNWDTEASSTNIVANINEIGIYDGTTRIAYTNNIGATSTMSGLSFVVPTTEKTYTIKVKLNKYGLNEPAVLGTDMQFKLKVDEAEGDISGDPVDTSTIITEPSKSMAPIPAKFTAVSLERNNGSSITIVDRLVPNAIQNVAIIKLTADNFGGNTDSKGGQMKAYVNKIQIKIEGDYAATSSLVSIERIGGSGNSVSTSTIDNNHAVLDLSTLTSDSDIALTSGQVAYFLVKAKTTDWNDTANPGTKHLTVSLDKLNGISDAGNYNFEWYARDGDPKHDLRIPGITRVDGIQITN